jgi:tetratricopeptide (TPR) repeat protein
LREAGHRVEIDVWDWRTGDNFIERMTDAMQRATAVVALFSNNYFDRDRWTREEWTSIIARRERLIPLAIEPLTAADIPDILSAAIRKDLYGLDEQAAIVALHNAVDGPTGPLEKPGFPGAPTGAPLTRGALGDQRPRVPSGAGIVPQVWNVRDRNPHFSGRETQIAVVRDSLLGGRRTVALHGLGGIGKTQIALEYAHRFASQYDTVWWIDAEQADQILVRYTELAARLGIAKPDGGTSHNTRALIEYLRTQDRWLVILDNADDPRHFEGLIPTGPGHVLITSRNPAWGDRVHSFNLGVFAPDDSRAYLTTRISGIPTEQAVGLAEDLGHLPLALAQAVGVISSGMTVDRYRLLLTDKTATLMANGDPHDSPATLAAAVDITTNRLATQRPDAIDLLRLGAFLGPDPIPIAWLEGVRHQLATVTVESDDFMWPQIALQGLARFGIARIDHETFQIHRLTQAILRDRSSEDDTAATEDDIAAILATATPPDPDTPANWSQWAALTSHLTARQETVARHPRLRQTLTQAAHYLLRSGQQRAASEFAGALLHTWTSTLGGDDPNSLTAAQYVGQAALELGDYKKSREIIEDTLARRRRVLGEDHRETLRSANDLAIAIYGLGKYEESLRMDEDTLARRRRVLGADHPETLRSEHNAATTLSTLERFEEARRMGEDALERARRTRGPDHPDTLHCAQCVAIALSGIGKFDESRQLDEDTLARRRRILGEDHPDTLSSAHTLGTTLRDLREFEDARRMCQEALAGRRRILGEDHPDTLSSAHSVSLALRDLGELGDARRIGEDTLARRRLVLGEDHPDTLGAAYSLAITLNRLREFDESRRLDEDTLARRRRVLGEDHPDTLRSIHNLAITHGRLRQHASAVRLLKDARTRSRRSLGKDHPLTERITRVLADALTAAGKPHEAQKLRNSTKVRSGAKRRK